MSTIILNDEFVQLAHGVNHHKQVWLAELTAINTEFGFERRFVQMQNLSKTRFYAFGWDETGVYEYSAGPENRGYFHRTKNRELIRIDTSQEAENLIKTP